MNTAIASISDYRRPVADVPRETISDYEAWIMRHQDVDLAKVEVTYSPLAQATRISVFISTTDGMDRADTKWLDGYHVKDSRELIEKSRKEFVRWYVQR